MFCFLIKLNLWAFKKEESKCFGSRKRIKELFSRPEKENTQPDDVFVNINGSKLELIDTRYFDSLESTLLLPLATY